MVHIIHCPKTCPTLVYDDWVSCLQTMPCTISSNGVKRFTGFHLKNVRTHNPRLPVVYWLYTHIQLILYILYWVISVSAWNTHKRQPSLAYIIPSSFNTLGRNSIVQGRHGSVLYGERREAANEVHTDFADESRLTANRVLKVGESNLWTVCWHYIGLSVLWFLFTETELRKIYTGHSRVILS
jgi:hypothetical protein